MLSFPHDWPIDHIFQRYLGLLSVPAWCSTAEAHKRLCGFSSTASFENVMPHARQKYWILNTCELLK